MSEPAQPSRILHLVLLVVLLGVPAGVAAAPMIAARTLDGEPVRLADYFARGRWTLVVVWTTYCPVCVGEFPILGALGAAHAANELDILGLAIDGVAARAAVADTLLARGRPFESLVTEPVELANGFERLTGTSFRGTPTYLLFDGDGELAASSSGPLDRAALEDFLARHRP
ncbi:MAG: TlpA family protein disulfide reductase [Gammaproteobacteria bacterium]